MSTPETLSALRRASEKTEPLRGLSATNSDLEINEADLRSIAEETVMEAIAKPGEGLLDPPL